MIDSHLDDLMRAVDDATDRYNELVDELANRCRPRGVSMRKQTICPGCGGRELIHAAEVLDRGEAYSRSKRALLQPSRWRLRGVGNFEAWICVGCGLVEWYVVDLDAVASRVDGEKRRLVKGAAWLPDPLADEPPGPDQEPSAAIERARRRIAALQSALDQLLARLFDRRGVIDRTTRGLQRCVSCGCDELFHAAEVLDRADGMLRTPMALEQPGMLSTAGAGLFSAWICSRCGAVEWYVLDLSGVSVDGETRSVLTGRAAEGPPPPLGSLEEGGERQPAREAEALASRLGLIAARIEELSSRAALDRSVGSLSRDASCPACGNGSVLRASAVLDRSEHGRDEMALVQPRSWRIAGKGTFAAWICRACGLVEWRVPDIAEVPIDGKRLRLVEGPPSGSAPYR